MTIRIGLSGGIASGKSTVSKLFQDLGAEIIDTDIIAREEVATPSIKQEIINKFGIEIYNGTNLDRATLRQIIFNDKAAKQWLESLLHPNIRQTAIQRCESSKAKYCIVVIPLLNNPADYKLDRVCITVCDHKTQVQRVCARDKITPEKAENIIAQQPSEMHRKLIADDTINTAQSIEKIKNRVFKLHNTYIGL